METYKFKRNLFWLELLPGALILSAILLFWYALSQKIAPIIDSAFVSIFLMIFWIYKNRKKYLEKKVILDKTQVTFCSYPISPNEIGVCTFDLSQITEIKSLYFPILGIYGVRIKTNGYINPFKVNFFFENHKQFYLNICNYTKKSNENVFIDKRLEKWINNQ